MVLLMATALTPMMLQYQKIKREIPNDALLFFRLGDFYELFFEDAKIASHLLNLTLTQRNGVPMCGIPHHAAEGYISRIIRSGRKVAICDQIEEAGETKGLLRRDITQILSPGTVMTDRFLNASQHNFVGTLCSPSQNPSDDTNLFGLAFLDITTGDFRVTEVSGSKALLAELRRVQPAELIIPSARPDLESILHEHVSRISRVDPWIFEYDSAFFTLKDHFKTQSLDGFGCQEMKAGIGAAGATLHYLLNQLRRQLGHVHVIHTYHPGDYMTLDLPTQRNLELLESQHSGERNTSLVATLDRTVTAMGARLLRDWVAHPLRSVAQIVLRHQAVAEFHGENSPMLALRESLREVKDLERIIGRLASGGGNARDLLGLKLSLQRLPSLRQLTATLHAPLLREQHARIQELPNLTELIDKAISDEPPLALKEGGIIREGYHPALDELRESMRSGKEWIARLQQEEIDRTGIKSLKIRFNSVFGYFIEITKSNLHQVPSHYIRKQTIATGERYVTPELKEIESKVLGSEERSMKLEYEIFQQVRSEAARHSSSIQESARALGTLDVLAAFAEQARHENYVRPTVDDGDLLDIVEGRHAVLEQVMKSEPHHLGKGGFVPNDTRLDLQENQVILITGPNMAGKSTYIRQVALTVLMAQIGSFVPARSAHIGLVDRIFTRVGAFDDISRGQSTFMVEMNETASILNNATDRSLIILDEIGRGTSTYDGISIAWAVAEYLHDTVRARTLFATHYHELTTMARKFKRIKNCNVAVREWNEEIIFLRKIHSGTADKSYGIQVARLAGLPRTVIDRAREMLAHLESYDPLESTSLHDSTKIPDKKKKYRKKSIRPVDQMLLFANPKRS